MEKGTKKHWTKNNSSNENTNTNELFPYYYNRATPMLETKGLIQLCQMQLSESATSLGCQHPQGHLVINHL